MTNVNQTNIRQSGQKGIKNNQKNSGQSIIQLCQSNKMGNLHSPKS
jgi:hypothetical protein